MKLKPIDYDRNSWRWGRKFWYLGNDRKANSNQFSLEWAALQFWTFSIKVSTTGEETFDLGLGIPGFRFWSKWTKQRPWANGGQVRLPGIRFEITVGLDHVDWCFGENSHSWSRDASWKERLRRNRLSWWRTNREGVPRPGIDENGYRKPYEPELIFETHTFVEMPEARYFTLAKIVRYRMRTYIGPYRLTRNSKRRLQLWTPFVKTWYSYDLELPDGIPEPGKGENSWDCGPDATYGMHGPVPDDYVKVEAWHSAVEYAVADLQQSVRITRQKRGAPADYSERSA